MSQYVKRQHNWFHDSGKVQEIACWKLQSDRVGHHWNACLKEVMCLSLRGFGIPTSSEVQGGWHTIGQALPLPLHYAFSPFSSPTVLTLPSTIMRHLSWVFPVVVMTLHWPTCTLRSSPTLPTTHGDSCYILAKRQVGIHSSICGTEMRGVS